MVADDEIRMVTSEDADMEEAEDDDQIAMAL